MHETRNAPIARLWLAGLAAMFVFTAAACGGDDDDSDATADPAAADAGVDDVDGDGDGEAAAPTDDGGAVGASATIDGTTYEATTEMSCLVADGFFGALFGNDDQSVRISVSLSPEESEPSESVVEISTDPDDVLQFESGTEVVASNTDFADTATVSDFSIDGRTVTGSATYVDTTKVVDGTAATVEGTFEVTCPDL